MAHYQIGTSYFVTKSHALEYYKDYLGFASEGFWKSKEQRVAARSYVDQLIEDRTISIGKPPASYGTVTGINSEGRYMVQSFVG